VDSELLGDGFEAGDPEARGFAVLLGFFAILALQIAFVVFVTGFPAVAVVRLVIEHEDVAHAHQAGHDALEHLSWCFGGFNGWPAALQEGTSAL
jgi:hypothetical protein